MANTVKFNIDTSSIKSYSEKLRKIHKSALPSAVRNTLNDAVVDMKKKEIGVSARKNFKNLKEPNFFKRFTGFDKAVGFNINQMKSTVGFTGANKSNEKDAVEGMEVQEFGGTIRKRSRYLKDARVGSNLNRKAKKNAYFNASKSVFLNVRGVKKWSGKSKVVAQAYMSSKKGNPYFIKTKKGKMLVQASGFTKSKIGTPKFKTKVLMMSRSVKKSRIKKTSFMREAGEKTSKKMDGFYIKQAEYQLKKYGIV